MPVSFGESKDADAHHCAFELQVREDVHSVPAGHCVYIGQVHAVESGMIAYTGNARARDDSYRILSAVRKGRRCFGVGEDLVLFFF